VIEGLSRLAIMPILLLGFGWGIHAAVATWVLGRCVGFLIDMGLLWFRLGIRPRLPDLSAVRPILVAALPLSGALLLFMVFARVDVPLLARISGDEAAGLLVGGYRPVEMASMLPSSLVFALYPALSRELALGAARALRTMERALVLILVLMVGGTVGLAFEADLIVRLILPHSLAPAGGVLSIACWSLIPATVDAATTALLLAQGRYKAALVPILLGVVTLVVLNLVLDPRMGAQGAAIARVAAQSVAMGFKMVLVFNFYRSPHLLLRLAGIAAASGALALVLWLGAPKPLLAIPLGALAYVAVVAVLRVVTLADLTALGSGFGGKSRAEPAGGG
jgi:O-antigen/teichoic acid export membrane protein